MHARVIYIVIILWYFFNDLFYKGYSKTNFRLADKKSQK